jgi:hypothetical protein
VDLGLIAANESIAIIETNAEKSNIEFPVLFSARSPILEIAWEKGFIGHR